MKTRAHQLPPADRHLHRALLTAFLTTGQLPALDALSEATGLSLDDVSKRLTALADGDYLAFDPAGHLTCLYPFSAVLTPHVVVIEGKRRYAMCSIDALGMAAMLGQEVTIAATCAHCGKPLRLVVRSGAVVQHDPPETVVIAHRDEAGSAADRCCPFTLFACGDEHAQTVVAQLAGSTLLSLAEALPQAEGIFGDLLRAEDLPVSRRRIKISSDDSSSHRSSEAPGVDHAKSFP